jgi:hypothetical protein
MSVLFWAAYLGLCFIVIRTVAGYLQKGANNLVLLSFAPMCVAIVNFILTNAFKFYSPRRMDLYVNRFDGLLGFPANRAAEFVHRHGSISTLAIADYFGCVIVIYLAAIAVYRLRGYDELIKAIPMFILAGILAPPIYWIFPVSGPLYAFSDFPNIYNGPVHQINLTAPDAIPNGLPSIHFALSLIVLYLLRHWRWGIVVGVVHVVLTGLATMGLGEHYALDLIAAVPYTWFVIRIARFDWLWMQAAGRTPAPSEATV